MKKKSMFWVLAGCLLLLLTGCESKPEEADKGPVPTVSSPSELTPGLAEGKGRIETEWFQDCDISFYCGDGQGVDLKVIIPFVVNGKVSEVSLVEESFKMGNASIARSSCFSTEDIDEDNGRSIWYISIEMRKPTSPCEINQVSLLCDGEKVDYPFGRMYAVDMPDGYIIDPDNPVVTYGGIAIELPEDPMKALPINLTFVGSADLFESDTSSDELVVDAKSMEQYYKNYRNNDKEEIWVTFDSAKSKYRFFEIYCAYSEKDGQKKAVRAFAPCRNRPIVVYWNRLQNKR